MCWRCAFVSSMGQCDHSWMPTVWRWVTIRTVVSVGDSWMSVCFSARSVDLLFSGDLDVWLKLHQIACEPCRFICVLLCEWNFIKKPTESTNISAFCMGLFSVSNWIPHTPAPSRHCLTNVAPLLQNFGRFTLVRIPLMTNISPLTIPHSLTSYDLPMWCYLTPQRFLQLPWWFCLGAVRNGK